MTFYPLSLQKTIKTIQAYTPISKTSHLQLLHRGPTWRILAWLVVCSVHGQHLSIHDKPTFTGIIVNGKRNQFHSACWLCSTHNNNNKNWKGQHDLVNRMWLWCEKDPSPASRPTTNCSPWRQWEPRWRTDTCGTTSRAMGRKPRVLGRDSSHTVLRWCLIWESREGRNTPFTFVLTAFPEAATQ